MKNLAPHRTMLTILSASMLATLAAVSGCSAPGGMTDKERAAITPTAAPEGKYAFWPLFPDEPRIQFLKAFGTSDDVNPSTASSLEKVVFGKQVDDTAGINKPYGVAMKNGKIYVCDIRGTSLVVLDLKKKQTRLVGTSGSNRLAHPVAVAVADDGMIYVADNERGIVMVFDANERYHSSMGFEKFKPVAVAVHGNKLYACDMAGQNVTVFDRKTGQKTGTIGSVGDGEGQFRVPLGLSVDGAGNIYVADMMACRVQKFSPEGTYAGVYGQLGDHGGSFARPKHMAIDSSGIHYVVDASFQNVQLFDPKYQVLMAFGAAGSFPGAMNLPAGICVTDDSLEYFRDLLHPGFEAKRLVVVTNQFGPNKVSVYALGQLKKGWSAQQLASASAGVKSGMGMSEDRAALQKAVGELPPEGDQTNPDLNPPEPDLGGPSSAPTTTPPATNPK
jgi:streptogramin lyase